MAPANPVNPQRVFWERSPLLPDHASCASAFRDELPALFPDGDRGSPRVTSPSCPLEAPIAGRYNAAMLELLVTGTPVETREFDHGRFELFRIAGRELGRATYAPGWKWTTHVGPIAGTALCEVEHVGYVIRGAAGVRMADGTELVLKAGDFFAIPPGHDSWVIGDDEYVSLHLLGADAYAREHRD